MSEPKSVQYEQEAKASSLSADVKAAAQKAKQVSVFMAATSNQVRNDALLAIGEALRANKDAIFEANLADLAAAREQNIAAPLIKRLCFDEAKLEDCISGLHDLVNMPDPLNQITRHTELAEGLVLRRVTCPIGVIGVIFESRPEALVQIATLCLKSGNAVLLKGGIEAQRTNRALYKAIASASMTEGLLPDGWIHLLESREEVSAILSMDDAIDLIIPRGSNAFVRYIMDNTNIPVLGHSSGVCHMYVDETAQPEMAARLAVDGKTNYPAACNAVETLLVNRDAHEALLACARALQAAGVRLRTDENVFSVLNAAGIASEHLPKEDIGREYGDLIINIIEVQDLDEAIAHINRYGSHHTDCIVTESDAHAARFAALVDSAGVYRNCSTRFADGYRYGFGAEVGISTGKIHARGPMGLEGLCSYKYLLEGSGDCVADFASGSRTYTHVNLMK
ncbi:MAG: glutamate-5-semialdehyde dehydrogenase [Clostridia bacterium]|nr:glutamate-5-semialdehyde dehydrogenase [Clostridia bacterium]